MTPPVRRLKRCSAPEGLKSAARSKSRLKSAVYRCRVRFVCLAASAQPKSHIVKPLKNKKPFFTPTVNHRNGGSGAPRGAKGRLFYSLTTAFARIQSESADPEPGMRQMKARELRGTLLQTQTRVLLHLMLCLRPV